MSIKLVAIDLDGTLLNSDHEVSEENKEAIRKAKEQGVKIVLVTGRPLKAMLHILEACNLTEPGDIALTYNGGLVPVSYTHLRAHETVLDLVCRLLLASGRIGRKN